MTVEVYRNVMDMFVEVVLTQCKWDAERSEEKYHFRAYHRPSRRSKANETKPIEPLMNAEEGQQVGKERHLPRKAKCSLVIFLYAVFDTNLSFSCHNTTRILYFCRITVPGDALLSTSLKEDFRARKD